MKPGCILLTLDSCCHTETDLRLSSVRACAIKQRLNTLTGLHMQWCHDPKQKHT